MEEMSPALTRPRRSLAARKLLANAAALRKIALVRRANVLVAVVLNKLDFFWGVVLGSSYHCFYKTHLLTWLTPIFIQLLPLLHTNLLLLGRKRELMLNRVYFMLHEE